MKLFSIFMAISISLGCGAAMSPNSNAQTLITKNIKDFGAVGDGKTNDSKAFAKAADFFNKRKGQGTLVISKGTYIVGSQQDANGKQGFVGTDVLPFKNCKNLIIEGKDGPILKMTDGLRIGAFDRATAKAYNSAEAVFADYNYYSTPGNVLSLIDCSNIKVRNFSINGNSSNMVLGGKFGDVGFQVPATGIYVINSINLSVENIKVSYCGQDGMMVKNKAPQKEKTPDQQITLKNCTFQYNARQGLSWVGGSGLRAENCDFSHTGRGKFSSSPAAGVDIEAEEATVSGGRFVNCTFINNTGAGMVADNGPSSDCSFTGCTFWGTTTWSMWTVKPKFSFTSCNFYGSVVHGCDATTDAEATRFYKCNFEDKTYQGKEPFGNFLMESNGRRRIKLEDCVFTAHTKRLVWNSGNDEWKEAEYSLYKNCTFNIYNIPFKKPDYYAKFHRCILDNNIANVYSVKDDLNNYIIAYGINVYRNPAIYKWIKTVK